MKINKAYKFRIYPTKSQIRYIEGCFNACRYVYNVSLNCEEQLYSMGANSNLTKFGLSYHLKYYKISEPWLNEYDSVALIYEMENLNSAYSKFFKGGGFPKYKSKFDTKQSFKTRQHIKLLDNHIKIPKVKTPIFCKIHREVEGVVKQMTISRDNKKYFVSIMCEINKEIKPIKNVKKEVGIDLGVKTFITKNNGTKIDLPKKLEEELIELESYKKRLQQIFSKKKKVSKNRNKIKNKINDVSKKIQYKRELFLHETSTELVKKYDRIYMEDLNVKSMTKSVKGTIESPGVGVKQKSNLNRQILSNSFHKFKTMMEYKSKFNGKELVKIGKFFPSSKTCNSCGYKNESLMLEERNWVCPKCNTKHDRDINAAKNILKEGRKILIDKK
tara:strand:+ start:2100 stop:3260 length:1161 start_codon:yes stop_codon:yes gene_type:complete